MAFKTLDMILSHKPDPSLISEFGYDTEEHSLYVFFHRQDWQKDVVYTNVHQIVYDEFIKAKSAGKFYLQKVKPIFNIKQAKMADKIIKLRVDITKVKKEWFFHGEKGIYMDLTVLYNEKPDAYKQNGMVTQDVPKDVYSKDKNIKGPILGNCKDWATLQERDAEAAPGSGSGRMVGENVEEYKDDLPF